MPLSHPTSCFIKPPHLIKPNWDLSKSHLQRSRHPTSATTLQVSLLDVLECLEDGETSLSEALHSCIQSKTGLDPKYVEEILFPRFLHRLIRVFKLHERTVRLQSESAVVCNVDVEKESLVAENLRTRLKNKRERSCIRRDLLLPSAEGNEEKPNENFLAELTDMESFST